MANKNFTVKNGLDVANSVIIANSTGIYLGSTVINSTSYSATSNNSLYLGGTIASSYQTLAGLASNVATVTSNNSLYLGGSAANTYLLTNQSFIPSRTGAVSRTAVSKFNEIVSPEDFGAVGNGSTDDTTAFNLALAAADNGPTLVLTSGKTYLLNTYTTYTTTGSIRIIGNNATIKGPSSTVDFIYPNGTFNIQGVSFDRWSSVIKRLTAASTIFTGCRFTNNYITNCTSVCFNIERPISNSFVDDNIFNTNTGGIAIRIGDNLYASQDLWNKISISRNKIDGLTGSSTASTTGILVYGREYVIHGNSIYNISGASGEGWGIYTKIRYSSVIGNTIRTVKSTSSSDVVGIAMKGSLRGDTGNGVNAFQNVVALNTVFDIGVLGTKGVGIRIQTGEVTVNANHIEDAGITGIIIDQVSGNDVEVSSNKILYSASSGTYGIYLNGSGSRFQILNNSIRNSNQAIYLNGSGALGNVDIIGNSATSVTATIVMNVSFNIAGLRIINNLALSGTYGIVNNGGAAVLSNLTIDTNDLSACSTQLSGISLTKTVANLSTASAVGAGYRDFVSDATAATFGTTVAGGGSIKTPVYSDGSVWKVG